MSSSLLLNPPVTPIYTAHEQMLKQWCEKAAKELHLNQVIVFNQDGQILVYHKEIPDDELYGLTGLMTALFSAGSVLYDKIWGQNLKQILLESNDTSLQVFACEHNCCGVFIFSAKETNLGLLRMRLSVYQHELNTVLAILNSEQEKNDSAEEHDKGKEQKEYTSSLSLALS
jgi:predicted regulator of Ras-like GTPase activity (Roadblock/LC7/MglB family)